jgi:hypothetical protein
VVDLGEEKSAEKLPVIEVYEVRSVGLPSLEGLDSLIQI